MDELKQAWAELERRLDGLQTELRLGRARSASRWLAAGPAVELALGVLAVVWLGASYRGHGEQPVYLLSVALLHLGAIVVSAANIRQLALIASLDWAAPVARAARTLEQLRAHRLRLTRWVFTLAPLAWAPLSVVVVVWIFGVEPNLRWVLGNALFGVVAGAALIVAARRFRGASSPWVRAILDDVAGRNLTAAIAFLSEVRRFETDEP